MPASIPVTVRFGRSNTRSFTSIKDAVTDLSRVARRTYSHANHNRGQLVALLRELGATSFSVGGVTTRFESSNTVTR